MAFSNYTDILPDPNYGINSAGGSGSTYGPGFASVKLASQQPVMRNRTHSGSLISVAQAAQFWTIDITYNPLTRAQFEPIMSFLFSRRNGLIPFYVSLPQYYVPQDATFANFVSGETVTTVSTAEAAGVIDLMVEGGSAVMTGTPSVGDMFNIVDSGDSTHTKAYKIVRVEDSVDYNTNFTQPVGDQKRIHFLPPMQKSFNTSVQLNFHHPLVRVILKSDVQEYSLDSDNLYKFSLKLEEAMI